MKRKLILILTVVMILILGTLGACAGDEPSSSVIPEGTEDTEVTDDGEKAAGSNDIQTSEQVLSEMNQGDEDGFFLNISSPDQSEIIVDANTITIDGQTSIDAAVSIGDEFVDIGLDGNFSRNVILEDGVNIIEVIASIASGQQYDQIITVIYIP